MSEIDDVRKFHKRFGLMAHDRPGHITRRKAIEETAFLTEKVLEFSHHAYEQDLAGMQNALVDLVYVAKSVAVMLGLPWEEAWAETHRANMEKEPGTSHRGHRVDVVKPESWEPPDHDAILARNGYRQESWNDLLGGEISEDRCRDDPGQ